jgi:hypothetical protein
MLAADAIAKTVNVAQDRIPESPKMFYPEAQEQSDRFAMKTNISTKGKRKEKTHYFAEKNHDRCHECKAHIDSCDRPELLFC